MVGYNPRGVRVRSLEFTHSTHLDTYRNQRPFVTLRRARRPVNVGGASVGKSVAVRVLGCEVVPFVRCSSVGRGIFRLDLSVETSTRDPTKTWDAKKTNGSL